MKIEAKKEELYWTLHAKEKMRQYHLSEQRVKRVLKHPERIEEGVAPKTIALMQSYSTRKHPKEIWVMYQVRGKNKRKIKIISAWRYPGRSPVGKLPDFLKEELNEIFGFAN